MRVHIRTPMISPDSNVHSFKTPAKIRNKLGIKSEFELLKSYPTPNSTLAKKKKKSESEMEAKAEEEELKADPHRDTKRTQDVPTPERILLLRLERQRRIHSAEKSIPSLVSPGAYKYMIRAPENKRLGGSSPFRYPLASPFKF